VTAVRPDVDEAGLRRYLLGLLPEGEAEALEEAYLASPEVLERLLAIEHDLLDDHAAGRLGPEERQALESRYLASPVLRERVVAARALHLAAPSATRSPGRRSVTAKTRWAGPVALAAGLVLALLSEWSGEPRPPHPRSVAASPAQGSHPETPAPTSSPAPALDASGLPLPGRQAPSTIALALSPVLLRGQQEPAGRRIPAGTETLVLELEGDRSTLPATPDELVAILETVEGRVIWRGEARRAGDAGKRSLVATARVPAAKLAPGDYLLALSTREADGTLYRYFFRVHP
jgi:hypothetical protein